MASTRFFRYLAPNVITLSSMIFGLVSIHSSATQNASLAGGMMAIWFLVLLKYDPAVAAGEYGGAFGGAKLFGDSFHTPLWAWQVFPIFTAVLAYLMASRLPMPKVGMTRNKLVSIGLMLLVFTGAACGFTQHYPEICFWMPTGWSIIFLIWGQASAKARAMYPPPLFPKKDPEKPLLRPQADLEDIVLDEAPTTSDPDAPPAADKPADG